MCIKSCIHFEINYFLIIYLYNNATQSFTYVFEEDFSRDITYFV